MLARGSSPAHGALTASAERVTRRDAQALKRLVQPWQLQALGIYDRSGIARFASQFLARPLSQVRLFPAYRTPDGEIEETEDKAAKELLDRVQDPGGGGRSQLQGSYGRLKFLIGECYLIASSDPDYPEQEQWEVVSPAELRLNADDTVVRMRAPAMPQPVQLDEEEPGTPVDVDEIRAWRLWQRHPAQSWLADSPMRPVLDDFEQLIMLKRAVKARVQSRLAGNGILVISEEITFPPTDQDTTDEDPEADELLDLLIEHFTLPIREPDSASGVVPYLLRLATQGRPIGDLIAHIAVRDPNEVFPEVAQIEQILKQVAISLDFPPESLLGVSDMNHWGSWMLDDETAKSYVFPACQGMCDDFTSAYYRPAARANNLARWQDLVIGYDAAGLVNHPDRAKDAKDVFGAGELSGEGLRESTGLTEFPPSEEERRRYLALQLRLPELAPEGEAAPSGTADEPPADGVDPTGGGQPRGAPPEGPPADDDTVVASANGNGHNPQLERLLGAAEFAVTRARAAAGARLRARKSSCEDCFTAMDGVPNASLAATLGRETVRELRAPSEAELVAGAALEFAETAARIGYPLEWGLALGEQLERHAAAGLYEPDPLTLSDGLVRLIAETVKA